MALERFCLNKMIGLTMRSVTWNRFPIKNLWLVPCFFHLWSEVTWMQICASLNHRKKMKAEPSWLIPLKPIENVELFIVTNLGNEMSLFCYIARSFSYRPHSISFTLQFIWWNAIFVSVFARVFTLSFVPRIVLTKLKTTTQFPSF